MRRRRAAMRPRPSNVRPDSQYPSGGDLSDWAWLYPENADAVRIILNRGTGVRRKVVWDSDYEYWFIEVDS